jgi:hypothetical protein
MAEGSNRNRPTLHPFRPGAPLFVQHYRTKQCLGKHRLHIGYVLGEWQNELQHFNHNVKH